MFYLKNNLQFSILKLSIAVAKALLTLLLFVETVP